LAKITQEKIAKVTGVSRATVSLVLSGHPQVRVSDETKQRVLAAAHRLGYPRAPATDLRSRQIGLLVTDTVRQIVVSDYYWAIYRGLEDVLWDHDYQLVLPARRDRLDEAGAIPKFVRHGHVAGLVVVSWNVNVQAVVGTGLPVVSVGYHTPNAAVDSIYPDHRHGVQLAADHLLQLGHRDFLLLAGPPEHHVFAERAAAYAERIRSAGGHVVATLSLQDRTREAEPGAYQEMVREFLAGGERRFTAVVGMTDLMASGALAALREAGLAVPEAVSVVGFLDIPLAASQEPPLTTVRVAAEEMGRVAAYRLLERLQWPDRPQGLKILMPVELIVRSSTAPPPSSPEKS
jgi:LacI family transcriptional regulator